VFVNVQVIGGALTGITAEAFNAEVAESPYDDCADYYSDAAEGVDYTQADATATVPVGGYMTRIRALGGYSDGEVALLTSGITYSITNAGGTGSTIGATTGILTSGSTAGTVTVSATDGTFTDTITIEVVTGDLALVTVAGPNGVTTGSPAETIRVGQVAQLLAVGTFTTSDMFCITPNTTFSAGGTDLTLTAAGEATGVSTNTSMVVTGVSGGISDTVNIGVSDAAITSIVISPNTPDPYVVNPGNVLQFDAIATLGDLSVVNITTETSTSWAVVDTDGGISINDLGLLDVGSGASLGDNFSITGTSGGVTATIDAIVAAAP
jgi:hypothetical protein